MFRVRELVLTHICLSGMRRYEALVALVDYDLYTVSVKRVALPTSFDEATWAYKYQLTDELKGLLASGVLRLYREHDLLVKPYDAWLAFDPVKGCL